MKKVLITGGAGFIAHHTIKYFLENTKDFIKSFVIKNQIPCLVVSHNNEVVGDNFFDEEIVIG